jgi:nitrite reductase/ring-hydroxylating ferredoxin subunit
MTGPLDRYVDRLLRRRRPRPFAPTEDDLAVLRAAIDLMAAAPGSGAPRPDFVTGLRARIADQQQADARAAESAQPVWRKAFPRRRILAATAWTTTGAAVGAAAAELVAGSGGTPAMAGPSPEIDPVHGRWQTVAASADVAEGAVLPFDLHTVNGFLRRTSGRLQAVSGVCTHQGCRLDVSETRDRLMCPCHGATFALSGTNLTHPRQVGALPSLPRLAVRELDGMVQVFAPGGGVRPTGGAASASAAPSQGAES